MKDYLNIVNKKYPIRRKEEEKALFRRYIIDEVLQYGYKANVEKLEDKHNNILIGNVDEAKVVFTAHYDTPAASLFPNLMMPRRPIFVFIYQMAYALLFAVISLFVAFLLGYYLDFSPNITILFYLLLYFGLFFFCTCTFSNKNNKNDNTSGVATILSLIEKNTNNKNIAFILFDNEEKGLLGSKAFVKVHSNNFKDKLVINLDCVGYGENVIFVVKDSAKELSEYKTLEKMIISNGKYNVHFYPKKGSVGNSDYKSFTCGIGVMTCKKSPVLGFYTPRIHTKFDTIANNENIEFISNGLTKFINDLNN